MSRSILWKEIVLIAAVSSAVFQYFPALYSSLQSGQLHLFSVDSSVLTSSKGFSYFKDILVVVFSCAFVFFGKDLFRFSGRDVLVYEAFGRFVFALIVFGVIPYLFDSSHVIFFIAGIRWVALLVFGMFVFFLYSELEFSAKAKNRLFYLVMGFGVLNFYFMFRQQGLVLEIYSEGLASSRMTGVFSSAGVAGAFSMYVAYIAWITDSASFYSRVGLFGLAFLGGMGTESRFALMAVYSVFCLFLYEERLYVRTIFGSAFKPLFFIGTGFSTYYLYRYMLAFVNRGDFSESFDEGGRIYNFFATFKMITSSPILEQLFGRGLGTGTSTAYTMQTVGWIADGEYRYNFLVDNNFLTLFFQVGLVGSLIFWIGTWTFFRFVFPVCYKEIRLRYYFVVFLFYFTCAVGNVFEQFFIVVGLFSVLGSTYFRSRAYAPRLEDAKGK